MITHGAPGDTFWDLVRKGAEVAARKNNITLKYAAAPQAPDQAKLVRNAIDSKVDGIAVTLPNPTAVGPMARTAVGKGIPVVGLNAGMADYRTYGIQGFFGQDEKLAGREAGKKLAAAGARNVLCIIHEQGNLSQEQRCAGVRSGLREGNPTGNGRVQNLPVTGTNLAAASSTIAAKLRQDQSIDWIMGLTAPVAVTAAEVARKDTARAQADGVRIATFDTDPQLLDAIRNGDVAWAIDQQPFLQGYLAVDSLWLAKFNGAIPGGGQPVLTGPRFVDQRVAAARDDAQADMREDANQ